MQDTRNPKAAPVDALLFAELIDEHVADIVARLNDEDIETSAAVLAHLPVERTVEVFDRPELKRAGDLLMALPDGLAGRILTAMSADRAAGTLRELDGADRTFLLTRLDFETAAALKLLLTYRQGTAGSIMTTEFVTVPATYTAAQTLQHLKEVERTRETIYAIHVLDPGSRELRRIVTLRQLISAEPAQPILEVGPDREPITVDPETDREEVARLISIHDLLAVPVLNHRGQVLGIVTVDDVIDAIVAESTEDVQKFGGVEAMAEPYLEIGFRRMIRKRAGWLCALFLSEMLTASAMQHFEDELQRAVVL
ncbi:MAG TPA: CBS domain-containing protein, partial [Phenylobacterium sp.]